MERKNFIDDLFAIHPPYIPMNGFKMNFNIKYDGAGLKDINEGSLKQYLKKRGILDSKQSAFNLEILRASLGEFYINIYHGNELIKASKIQVNFKNDLMNNLSLEIFNKIFTIDVSE